MLKVGKETINEHIRNALSPLNNLISIVEDREGIYASMEKETYDHLLRSTLDASKQSIEELKVLGQHKYEENQSEYYRIKK